MTRPASVRRILEHLGLPSEALDLHPARPAPQLEMERAPPGDRNHYAPRTYAVRASRKSPMATPLVQAATSQKGPWNIRIKMLAFMLLTPHWAGPAVAGSECACGSLRSAPSNAVAALPLMVCHRKRPPSSTRVANREEPWNVGGPQLPLEPSITTTTDPKAARSVLCLETEDVRVATYRDSLGAPNAIEVRKEIWHATVYSLAEERGRIASREFSNEPPKRITRSPGEKSTPYVERVSPRLVGFWVSTLFAPKTLLYRPRPDGKIDEETSSTHPLAFSSVANVLAFADGVSIGMWNVADGKMIGEMGPGFGEQRLVVFSPDGSLLASVDTPKGTLRVWDVKAKREVGHFNGREWGSDDPMVFHEAKGVAFAAGGATVVIGDERGKVSLWSWRNGTKTMELRAAYEVSALEVSPDERQLAVASGIVEVFGLSDGAKKYAIQPGGQQGVRSYWGATFSPDGTMLAGTPLHSDAAIWNAASGRKRLVLQGGKRGTFSIGNISFGRDGSFLTGSFGADSVGVWDARNGKQLATVKDPFSARVHWVGFSHDGSIVAWKNSLGAVEVRRLSDLLANPAAAQPKAVRARK